MNDKVEEEQRTIERMKQAKFNAKMSVRVLLLLLPSLIITLSLSFYR